MMDLQYYDIENITIQYTLSAKVEHNDVATLNVIGDPKDKKVGFQCLWQVVDIILKSQNNQHDP